MSPAPIVLKKKYVPLILLLLLFSALSSYTLILPSKPVYADCLSNIVMNDLTQTSPSNIQPDSLGDFGKGFLHDKINAFIASGGAPVTTTLKVYNDKSDGNYAFMTYVNTPSLTFSLEPVSYYLAKQGKSILPNTTESTGEMYTYEVSFRTTCTSRIAQTNAVSYQLPTNSLNNFTCLSAANANMVATENGANKLILFTNGVASGGNSNSICQSSTLAGLTPQVIQSAGSKFASTNDPKFDSAPKDSVLFYPHSDHLIFTSLTGGGQVDAIYWDWIPGLSIKKVDPTSVRVIPLVSQPVTGGEGNTVDMDIDNLGPGGTPLNLWVVDQYGTVFKIPWQTAIAPIINPWLASIVGGGNAHPLGPVKIVSSKKNPFYFVSSNYTNGIKVVSSASGGYVYVVENAPYRQNIAPGLAQYNVSGTLLKWIPFAEASPTYAYSQLQGYVDPALGNFQILSNTFKGAGFGRDWNIDGMTMSPDGKYLYIASRGSVIWVVQNINSNAASLYGPALTDLSCGQDNLNSDGLEIDSNNMMYITCQSGAGHGIYTINGNDLLASAKCNRNNAANGTNACTYAGQQNPQLFKGYWAKAQLYYNGPLSFDDIAPLAGNGSSAVQSSAPYYDTCDGPVYSYKGYSSAQLDVNSCPTAKGQKVFSTSLLTQTSGVASFPIGTQGSYWKWNFQGNQNSLDTSPSNTTRPTPQLTASQLYSTLCIQSSFPCPKINQFKQGVSTDTISSTDTQINQNSNTTSIISNTPSSGTLTIDTDEDLGNGGKGGLQENGILFVNKKPGVANSGNVVINADRKDDWASQSPKKRLIVIAEGNITINPSPGGGVNASDSNQTLNIMALADGSVTFANYSSLPSYPQILHLNGSIVGWNGVNFQLDTGVLNVTSPSVQIAYDTGFLLEFSKLFSTSSTTVQVGF